MTKHNNDRCKKLAAAIVLIAHRQEDRSLYQILSSLIEVIDEKYFFSDKTLSDNDILETIKEYHNNLPTKIDQV